MPRSPDYASRVLMAIGSVFALLGLGLPFAFETSSSSDASGEKLFGGTEIWSGWSLARKSGIDGHHPLSNLQVFVLVAAAVGLVVLAWVALERGGTGRAAAAAGLGAALLVGSVLIGNTVKGNFGDGHEGSSGGGLPVWQVALLLVVVAALRAVLQAGAKPPLRASAGCDGSQAQGNGCRRPSRSVQPSRL